MKKIAIIILTLVLASLSASATTIDYGDERIIVIEGDIQLVFYNASHWGDVSDLTITKLSYDNSTNLSFYIIKSNDVSHKIVPGIFNGTIVYNYLDAKRVGVTHTFMVDYSSIQVPIDPEILILQKIIENLTLEIEEYKKINISGYESQIASLESQVAKLTGEKEGLLEKVMDYNDLALLLDRIRTDRNTLNSTVLTLSTENNNMKKTLEELQNPFSMGYTTYLSYGYPEGHFYLNYSSFIIGIIVCLLFLFFFVYKYNFSRNLFSKVFSFTPTKKHQLKSVKSLPEMDISEYEKTYLEGEKE